jgi:hypothetical protein
VAVFTYGAVLCVNACTEMVFVERDGMSLGTTTVSSVRCDTYVWIFISKMSRVVVTVISHGLGKRNCIVPVHQSALFGECIDFL